MISRRAFWITIAVGCVWMFGISQVHAHHAIPPHAKLAKVYPELVTPGFKWGTLERAWRRSHPAAERHHRRLIIEAAYRREADRYRAEFMCIAGHESHWTWDISTGNGYYGGLQMDRSFQGTYGPELYRTKGTADNWTIDEQIAVASRAVPRRGFTPWPNTGRMCGLI